MVYTPFRLLTTLHCSQDMADHLVGFLEETNGVLVSPGFHGWIHPCVS